MQPKPKCERKHDTKISVTKTQVYEWPFMLQMQAFRKRLGGFFVLMLASKIYFNGKRDRHLLIMLLSNLTL